MEMFGEKLISRMWESLVDKGIGGLLTPFQIKREGRARIDVRREEILVIAQAEADANEVRAGRSRYGSNGLVLSTPHLSNAVPILNSPSQKPSAEVESPPILALQQAAASAVREEVNVARAILHAEDILTATWEQGSEEHMDEDWLYEWRDRAGKVSKEDLQRLWGQVLAGEVKEPGSFSLRTLAVLSLLKKSDAELIARIAPFVADDAVFTIALRRMGDAAPPFTDFLRALELGIITIPHSARMRFDLKKEGTALIKCHNKVLVLHQAEKVPFELECYTLTDVGREVMKLGSFDANMRYLKEVAGLAGANGCMVEIGDLLARSVDDSGQRKVQIANLESFQQVTLVSRGSRLHG